MLEVCRREKEVGIVPESNIDTYMKVTTSSLSFFFFFFALSYFDMVINDIDMLH